MNTKNFDIQDIYYIFNDYKMMDNRYAQEIAAPGGLDGLRQRLAKVHLRFYAALFVAMSIALYCYRL